MSYEKPTTDEVIRDSLLYLMRDISEFTYCAGWMMALEFALWSAVQTGNCNYGIGIPESDLARLKSLHEMAGGWWIWQDEEEQERFVTTEEWLPIYADWVSKNRSQKKQSDSLVDTEHDGDLVNGRD